MLLGALLLLLLLTVMPPLRRRRAEVRDGVTAGESSSGSDKSAHDVDELQALRLDGSSESDSYSSERLDVELERAWLGRVRGAPPLSWCKRACAAADAFDACLTRDEEPLLARLADTAIGNDCRAARGDSSGDSSDDSAADSAADAESDTVLFT